MKPVLTLFALLAALPATAQELEPEAWFASRSALTQQSGAAIYSAVCAGCHMPDGQGAEGAGHYPALAGNDRLEFPDYAISLTIHGQKAMPPLGGVLNDDQIAEVVSFIRTNFGNDYADPVTAEAVAAHR
ncbi:c-type cytochrome [Plastorhodobacter daqingensis]|uniref:C-type cytochrome n=1 Tax=Plastorhodobacter daqingensis TaxID=1387281 RepID=A0ABW2UJ63_9RHOB